MANKSSERRGIENKTVSYNVDKVIEQLEETGCIVDYNGKVLLCIRKADAFRIIRNGGKE